MKNIRSIIRKPLVFRVIAPLVLLVPLLTAAILADYAGKLIEFFPAIPSDAWKSIPEPTIEKNARRPARRVIVVVADGLSPDALEDMPFLNSLAEKGAHFTARAESPSYSRTGYSTIGTGVGPEFSGVSSNSYLEHSRVDSIFHRARKAGLRTAFVGYDWWLDLFERDLMIASLDMGKPNAKAKPFTAPPGFIRRVLVGENYIRVAGGDWRAFKREKKVVDRFGNPNDTRADEDLLRVREGVRILRNENPDLLFIHLQNTDYHGHIKGSAQAEAYRRAARNMDEHVRELLDSVDANRDAFILTADHGFTTANVDAGHGGYERDVMNVPLIMYGAGTIAGTRGSARQRDVAPTISALLGLPFPRMSMGRPLLDALRFTAAEKKAVTARVDREQKHLAEVHLRYLGLAPEWKNAWQTEYLECLERQVLKTQALNLIMAGLVFAGFFFLLMKLGLPPRRWYLWWALYEIVFLLFFVFRFNVYSMSMYAGLGDFMRWALIIHCSALGVCLGTRIASARLASVTAGIHEVVQAIVPGTALKTAAVFVMVANASLMPHGFWLFAALLMGAQTLFAAITAMPMALLAGPRSQ